MSFLLNYEAMLTDCSPATRNNKGKKAIGLLEMTNQFGSCSSIQNRVEDMHLSPSSRPTDDNCFAHNLAQLAFQSGTCNLWLAPVLAYIYELAVGDGVNFESE
jgi:hypothetical protein